ncbi:DUF835 domain-containing protein [Thermococcus camini]|uniref:DUF835 domain-containing protein n=1 Tax=Thermococcus camini TaxID=2016373 RepID=A0A7G2D930_9EURY|nr:DUF835 domain-containing protein [Thermococcus camini]CAD5245037.1 conserved membrane protein of unknown function [Thermococcus camini]
MTLIPAILVEISFVGVSLLALKYRGGFTSHYPELKRFYDYTLSAFITGAAAKFTFLFLDLRDNGMIALTPEEASLINTGGNALILVATAMFLIGWANLLKALMERYELIPVVEFAENERGNVLKPGLHLCNLPNCYPVIAKLLRGRAGLIVSRHPPEVIRQRLKIEKTPVLWLTTIRSKNTVSPTRLEFLLQTMVDFMRKTEDPKVIFLDGVEYLILENGFAPVFKFLTTLKDYTTIYNTVVIVPLYTESMDERAVNLMYREFERLRMEPP